MEKLAFNDARYKAKISKWIDKAHRKQFYHYCSDYDTIIFETIRRKLDDGEAGAIAQAERIGVFWFFSDDLKNIKFIQQNYGNIRQHSIFFLIALADIMSLLPDYETVLIDYLEILGYERFSAQKKRRFNGYVRSE